jgi:CRP-like cAMP-binding protein
VSESSQPKGKAEQPQKARTVDELVAVIVQAVSVRDFRRADETHAELVATFPAALSDIIRAANIIEEEKSAAIEKDHLLRWRKLYQTLSDEERNCLYYSMKKHLLPPKTLILAHRAVNDRLFLIEQGQVIIFRKKDGKNVVLAQLGPGDILGEYTFSHISLCSASAITRTPVQLRCLESRHTDTWEDKHPGLYEKLLDFCLKGGKVDEILKNKRLEKQRFERYPAEGRAKLTFLTAEGKPSDLVFGGSLADISLSGACLGIRFAKKATARSLLDKQLVLHLAADRGSPPFKLSLFARVVRVSFLLYGDYTIHVSFSELQTEETVRKFRLYTTRA